MRGCWGSSCLKNYLQQQSTRIRDGSIDLIMLVEKSSGFHAAAEYVVETGGGWGGCYLKRSSSNIGLCSVTS